MNSAQRPVRFNVILSFVKMTVNNCTVILLLYLCNAFVKAFQ